ncbi:MAG: hypothetical protein V1708_01225 [Candidatus Micrarchaeota archaeon]
MDDIVVPGELAYDAPHRFDGSFIDNGKTYVSVVSVRYGDKIVALKGKYKPLVGDYVVGIVEEVKFAGYEINLNSPYQGMISSKETREQFAVGDVVSSVVRSVDEVNEALLVEPRKLYGGRLLEIESVKIPRVIGRNSSMVSLLEQFTKSKIFVGKNGRVYLKDGNLALAVLAILKISKEAHLPGLTDRMNAFLAEEAAKNGSAGAQAQV